MACGHPVASRVRHPLGALLGFLLLCTALTTGVSGAQAAEDDRFTFVVIPDTQSYVLSDTYHPTFGQQTQWIVDHRAELGVSFVAQLGDLVESHPNVPQWQRASQYMATLDAAGVPNSVIPGNHDMDVVSGEAARFDEYFPVSRYSQASWNSPTASYGGYLGQNLFGPDPVDRKNKDSFSLFTAAGRDFLVLNLEYESPDAVLAWAQKVIDAHPTRRVIVVTHGFINTIGARSNSTTRSDPTRNTAAQVWNKLVYNNCSIFMVVNGHWRDGDIGEARRTDSNACGKPVHQILSNYQERANGGDGWLRYYTFDPANNSVEAVTYSPSLDRYETDADSAFSLAYDMTPAGTATDRVLVPGGASWRWRYTGTAFPVGWTTSGFDDSAWAQGPASLGFGSYGPATNIDVPPPTSNRPRSAQFRRSFTIANASALSDVNITTRADDGVVLYVNGTEIGRHNLPTGTLNVNTYATAAPRTSTATGQLLTFTVPASLLLDGTNTIAASTHLNYRSTPDISFDLTMTGKAPAP